MSSDLAFVDSHIHYWDRPHPTLAWVWLEDDFVHPQLGDIRPLKDLTRYTPDEYLADIEGSGVTKAVHVQAAIGTPDPVEETRWLSEMAEATGWPHAEPRRGGDHRPPLRVSPVPGVAGLRPG